MGLKINFMGQRVSDTKPDVLLTGDPAVDQVTLRAAGYAAGRVMARINSLTAGRGPVIVPYDGALLTTPSGTLINGAGNYAESIGPSGSKLMPIERAKPIFELTLDSVEPACYVAAPATAYTIGCNLYVGTTTNKGVWTTVAPNGTAQVLGLCTHVPTGSEPWLGVEQLF